MAERRFRLAWEFKLEHEDAGKLAEALEPETRGHASLSVEEGELRLAGEGSAGESLHTLDDALACLTGAVEVLDETDEG